MAARRLGAIAGGVALAFLGPLAQITHADESGAPLVPGGDSVPADEAIFEGDVGVLLGGPEGEEPTPPDDDTPPAPQPPPEEEQPAPPSGPSASPAPSSSPALPKRSASRPAFVAALRPTSGIGISSSDRRTMTLEDIFLRDGRLPSTGAAGALALQAARPTVPGADSSLPSLLLTSLLAMLGALLLAYRQYGPSLFAPPAARPAARSPKRRPSAPRGWRVVPVARDLPLSVASAAPTPAIERPVLPAAGTRRDRSVHTG